MAGIFIADCESISAYEVVADKIGNFLATMDCPNTDLIVLGDRSTDGCRRISEFFIELYRKHGLHVSDRTAIVSAVDELVCAQLVLAANNKRVVGEFDVDTTRVVNLHRHVICSKLESSSTDVGLHDGLKSDSELESLAADYRSFLQDSNAVDLADVCLAVQNACSANAGLKEKIAGTNFLLINPRFHSSIEMNMISQLADGKTTYRVSMCLPLDESFGPNLSLSRVEINIERSSLQSIASEHSGQSDCNSTATLSATELYLEQVFLGYMRLLLNSRDELSLARVINVPCRGLDHRAFTDVKHESKERGLSMFQTIVSFVMRIRLGGKGYAPTASCPLLKHSKGLAEFNDLMQKLQTIVEEDNNVESAVRRVLAVVKNCIVKSSEFHVRHTSVELVTTRFYDEALSLLQSLPTVASSKLPCVTGSISGNPTLQVIRTMLDRRAVIPLPGDGSCVLSDSVSSQKTPIRFTSLLSVFRSPEDDADDQKTLDECQKKKKRPLAEPTVIPLHKSCLDWAPNINNNRTAPITITDFIPSKTLVCSAADSSSSRRILDSFNDKENAVRTAATPVATVDKSAVSTAGDKRTQSQSSLCPPANPPKKQKKAAKPKVVKLEKGQRQLNSFFRA